jgi:hypothetical protein
VPIVVWAGKGQARIEIDKTAPHVKRGIRLDFLAAARMIWRGAPTARDRGTCPTEVAPTVLGSISPNLGKERHPRSLTNCGWRKL